jgi:hypothetical protein
MPGVAVSWAVALHKHGRSGEIVNGTRATVTAVDNEAVTITVRTDAGAELTLARQWSERDRLTGQSLLAVEPYSAVPNTYTIPFRGGFADLRHFAG